jgi:hypothetical protein
MTTKEIGAAAASCPARERRFAIRFGSHILHTRVLPSSDCNMQLSLVGIRVLRLHTKPGGTQ